MRASLSKEGSSLSHRLHRRQPHLRPQRPAPRTRTALCRCCLSGWLVACMLVDPTCAYFSPLSPAWQLTRQDGGRASTGSHFGSITAHLPLGRCSRRGGGSGGSECRGPDIGGYGDELCLRERRQGRRWGSAQSESGDRSSRARGSGLRGHRQ